MTMNWFIAWPVEVPLEVLAGWERDAPIGVKYHHRADFHIMLAMLGRHDVTLEKKLTDLVRAAKIPTPAISLKSILALPQPRRFSTLVWEIANGRLELEKQIAKWRPRICREMGAFAEASPEIPYLAFARPERKVSNEDRDRVLEWAESCRPPAMNLPLGAPTIFKWSNTTTDGRQFEQIACTPALSAGQNTE